MPTRHSASVPLPPRELQGMQPPPPSESMHQPRHGRYDSPPRAHGGGLPRQPQAWSGNWAREPAPPVLGLGIETVQGMTNAMNGLANQVIRNSGMTTRNAGWPYFDETYRNYPAFKKKFEYFWVNYHYGTPSRELVQHFREMCLPEKIAVRIRKVESMETAWRRLDALFKDETAFIKNLMQEIWNVSVIKDGDDERLMYYYVLLQSHIEEACRAGLEEMLLISANMEEMMHQLPN
jgi:hypothetical protein